MEKTQQPINNTITLSQFMSLEWSDGFPKMLLALFGEILGKSASHSFFKSIEKDVKRMSCIDFDQQSKTDPKLQGVLKLRMKKLDHELQTEPDSDRLSQMSLES